MTHRHLITDPATAATFITAGKATFTLANTTTDNHATYRVEAVKGEDNVFTVALFTGTDNTDRSSYTAIGEIRDGSFTCTLPGPRSLEDMVADVRDAADRAGDTWAVSLCDSVLSRLVGGREPSERQMEFVEARRRRYSVRPVEATPVLSSDTPKVRGFGWVKGRVEAGRDLGDHVQFWTEGRCCTCGRKLTNPKSIDALEGPICSRRRGIDLTGIVLPIGGE